MLNDVLGRASQLGYGSIQALVVGVKNYLNTPAQHGEGSSKFLKPSRKLETNRPAEFVVDEAHAVFQHKTVMNQRLIPVLALAAVVVVAAVAYWWLRSRRRTRLRERFGPEYERAGAEADALVAEVSIVFRSPSRDVNRCTSTAGRLPDDDDEDGNEGGQHDKRCG